MSTSDIAARLKEVKRQLAEPAAARADGEDEYRAYASGRVGNRPQISVTFAKEDGRGKTSAYSHLYCLEFDNPNLGRVAEFTRHRVTIRGRNLGDHKVREIQETDELHAMTLGPAAPVVTAIEILVKRDGEER